MWEYLPRSQPPKFPGREKTHSPSVKVALVFREKEHTKRHTPPEKQTEETSKKEEARPGVPWPMSEEKQQQQNPVDINLPNEPLSSSSLVAIHPSIEATTTTTTPAPAGGRPRLAQSPAGALLVEVSSGHSIQSGVPPSTVVREYCQFLVR